MLYTTLFITILIANITVVVLAIKKVIRKRYSYTSIFIMALLSLILISFKGFTFERIGILKPSSLDIFLYSVLTIGCCIFIFLLNKYWFKHKRNENTGIEIQNFVLFTIISVTIQEFLFRSFLYYSLTQMNILNIYTMTIMSCLFFGIDHLAFKGKIFKIGVFLMGIVWGAVYFYIPNLILISISHTVIGIFAYYQGLVSQDTFFIRKNSK